MKKPPAKRSVGRPRLKPANRRRREWWASDAEIRQLQKVADARGCSVQELVRQLAIAATRATAASAHSPPPAS